MDIGRMDIPMGATTDFELERTAQGHGLRHIEQYETSETSTSNEQTLVKYIAPRATAKRSRQVKIVHTDQERPNIATNSNERLILTAHPNFN